MMLLEQSGGKWMGESATLVIELSSTGKAFEPYPHCHGWPWEVVI